MTVSKFQYDPDAIFGQREDVAGTAEIEQFYVSVPAHSFATLLEAETGYKKRILTINAMSDGAGKFVVTSSGSPVFRDSISVTSDTDFSKSEPVIGVFEGFSSVALVCSVTCASAVEILGRYISMRV